VKAKRPWPSATVAHGHGRFAFTGQAPGHDELRQELPNTACHQTAPAPGAALEIDLAADEQRADARLGARQLSGPELRAVTGTVFHDLDADGTKDAGEPALTSRPTVYIDANNNALLDDGERGAVVGSSGAFTLGSLAPNVYRLRLARGLAGQTPVRASTFGADGSLLLTVPPGATSLPPLTVGAYMPNAKVTDAWLAAYDLPNVIGATVADLSVPSAAVRDARITNEAGQVLRPTQGRFDLAADGTTTLSFQFAQMLPDGRYTLTIPGAALKGSPGLPTPQDYVVTLTKPIPPSTVVGRHLFYDDSAYDAFVNQLLPLDPSNDAAIAPDRRVLLPGEASGPANVSNYARGVNGLMIDVSGLPHGVQLMPQDVEVRWGNSPDPATWGLAPQPAVGVRPRAGAGGSDRIVLMWGSLAPKNTWVRVTLKATVRTALAAADSFYVGSLVGETVTTRPFNRPHVDVFDAVATLRNTGPAGIDNPYDVNRDKRVNARDVLAVRANQGRMLVPLPAAVTATPSLPQLLAETDSGQSQSDRVTTFNNGSAARALKFRVDGTVAGATVTLYAGDVVVGSALATDGSTVVATNGTAAFADGAVFFTAKQTLSDGTTTPASLPLTVTIDTAAPGAPPAPDLTPNSDTGASSNDDLTTLRTPTFFVQGAPYFRAYLGDTLSSSAFGGGNSFTYGGTPLAEGVHRFSVAAVDAAGNESARGPATAITVDLSPPAAAAQAQPVDTAGGADHTFIVTYSDALGVDVGRLDDNDLFVSGPDAMPHDATLVTVVNATNGSPRSAVYRIAAPGGYWDGADNGTYNIFVRPNQVYDVAGNTAGVVAAGTFVVDANNLIAVDLTPAADSGLSDHDDVTNFNNGPGKAPSFQVVNTRPGDVVTVFADGIAIGSAAATDFVTTVTAAPGRVLADGPHTITARQHAPGGADGAATPPISILVDTVALAPGRPELEPDSDTGTPGDGITADTTPTFDITTTEAGLIHLESDGALGAAPPELAGFPNTAVRFTTESAGLLNSALRRFAIDSPSGAYGLTPADLNGDANIDFVVRVNEPGGYSVMLGDGRGDFAVRSVPNVPVGDALAADLNGDGKIDLISWGGFAGIIVHPGNGDGTFRPRTEIRIPGNTIVSGADVGDLNGDTKPDIVVGNGDGIHVLFGRGDGTFADPVTTVAAISGPRDVLVGDFDGDGKLDVADSNYTDLNGFYPGFVRTYFGNGDGTLRAGPRTTDRLRSGKDTVAADFTGDGRPDLVRVDNNRDGFMYGITLLRNNGDGSLAAPVQIDLESEPQGLEVADFDRDGDLDVATMETVWLGFPELQETWFVLARNNGDGTFAAAEKTVVEGGPFPADMTLADVNNDGRLDFVSAVQGGAERPGGVLVIPGASGALPPGPHVITAWLEDVAGNRSPDSEATTILIEPTTAG
jgi:hypothetical protein